MAKGVRSAQYRVLLLLAALGSLSGCGGGSNSDDDDDSAGNGSGSTKHGNTGGTGNASSGGTGNTGTVTELGWPAALPSSTAQCESASGAEGCYFEGCCSELVACAKDAACAKIYDCYVTCPSSDDECFVNCASSSLAAGAEDFGAATSCLASLTPSCGALTGGGGTGGAGGTGGTSGDAGAGNAPNDVGPLGSAKDSLGWDLNVSDDPLVAEYEIDEARAVSEVVTIDGGTVTATASDGTTFELVFPAGALYGTTLITLTPLASLAVPPFDGTTHGVQIEPDGLPLLRLPTLTITPPDGEEWPLDEQVPLSIAGGDHTVGLAGVDPSSEALELVLPHFSAYAVLLREKGLDSVLSDADIRSRFGGSVEERFQSASAERIAQERLRVQLGAEDPKTIESLLGDLYPEFEKYVVQVRIDMAHESCAAGKLAIQTLTGFLHDQAVLGAEPDDARFLNLIPVVADVCLREEYEICRDEHILTRIIPTFLGYWRQAELLGLVTELEGARIPPNWVMKAEQSVKSCLQFELALDSDVQYSDGEDVSMNETVTSRAPFGYTASFTLPTEVLPPHARESGAFIIGGPAPLESTAYGVQDAGACVTIDAEEPKDGELYVSSASFTPGDVTEEDPDGNLKLLDFGVSIAIVPNLSSWLFTARMTEETGCGEVSATGENILSWSQTLGAELLADSADPENGALIKEWDIPEDGGQIIAVKDIFINKSDGSGSIKGPVNLVVLHAPQPLPTSME